MYRYILFDLDKEWWHSNLAGTTNEEELAINKQIEELGLKKYFEEIIVVPNGKLVAEEKASVLRNKGAILMIGDTKLDYKATQMVNIEYKHMNEGFHRAEYVYG